MPLRIKRDADFERRDAADAFNQFRRGAITLRVWLIRSRHAGHVAPERHDMADAGVPIGLHDLVDLAARRAHASQMRGGLEGSLFDNALDSGMGALAGRTAGAIGHRDESRLQRLAPLDRRPQRRFRLVRPGRGEFERHRKRPSVADHVLKTHAASLSFSLGALLAAAVHNLTVSLSADGVAGAMVSLSPLFRPAPAKQPSTSR